MIRLGGIEIENVAVFKDKFRLDFEEGIYLVKGLNKDSKELTSNASGKTLLFSTIPYTIFNTFTDNFGRKKSKLSILNENGRIRVDFEGFSIEKFKEKGKERFKIYKDGKDITPRTLSLQKEEIEKLVSLTENEFFSYVYVSPFGNFPLIYGTPNEKFKFIYEFFSLYMFEELKQYFKDKYNEIKSNIAYLESYKEEYESLKLEIEKQDIDDIKKKYKELKDKKEELEKEKERYYELKSKYDTYILYKNQLKSIKSKLNRFKNIKDLDLKSVKKKLKELKSEYSKFVEHNRNYLKYKEYVKEFKALKDSLVKPKKPKVDNIEVLKDRLYYLKTHKKYLNEIKETGICPVCQSKVKNIKDLDYNKEIKDLENKIQEYEEYKEKVREYNRTKSELKELKRKIDKLKKYKNKVDTDKIEKEIDNLKILINDFSTYKELVSEYKSVKDKYKKLGKIEKPKFDKELKTKIEAIEKEITKHAIKLKEYEENVSKFKSLKEKLTSYPKLKEELRIYEALFKAYDNKGIRTQVVKMIVSILEKKFNSFSDLYFEPISFKFEVNNNNLNIYAVRKNGIVDVKLLSGAEKRFFMLISLLSLLSFIPNSKRTDFIILDEMDANLDDTNRKFLYENFIPELNRIIDKVIIITPQSVELPYKHKIIEVVKENKKSSIIIK